MAVYIKTQEEVSKIHASCTLLSKLFLELKSYIKEGLSTLEIDKFAYEFITKNGAKPAFKGYRGFTGSICASVNEEVIHGIPSKSKILKSGDIFSVDCGLILNGFYSDMAYTYSIGEISLELKTLLKVTKESLYKGIEKAYNGARLLDISKAIEGHIKPHGFGIVRDYTGHGVGIELHEEPYVPNYYEEAMPNIRLKEGMVLAIEPMVNLGTYKVKVKQDKWTVITRDLKPSAHFEHTIAITKDKPLILTEFEL